MQRITRARLVLSLALVGALALAGCGGDDAYNISAEDQARIDTLTDDVAAANKKAADDLAAAKTQAEADLKAAQDEIDSLTAQIGMAATDDMAATGLHKQLADARAAATTAQMTIGELNATIGMMPGDDGMGGSGLQGDLAMYKATAADLQDTLGMMADGDMAATGLYKELADAQATVAGLEDTLGMMADGDMAATGLYKELADAQDKVAGLEGMIGAAPGDDGMGGSGLEADLAKYKGMVGDLEMKIGMMDDPTTTEADESSGLYKQLADAMAEAQMYKDTIGMEADGDNPEATGLYKMIADAEAKATMYKAQLDVLQGTIDTGDMADASVMAKALYMKLADAADDMVDKTPDDQESTLSRKVGVDVPVTADDGSALNDAGVRALPELNVMTDIEDGMLTAKVKDYTMADAAPDMIEGWQGVMLADKDENTIVLYSDKGATDTRLLDVFDGKLDEDGVRTYIVNNLETIPTGTAPIAWSNVKRDDADATGGAKPGSTEFMGSVMNIPGTFSCTPGTDAICGIPARHSDGTVLSSRTDPATTSGWMFVPDDPLARIPGADANYLVFGWWLMKDAGGMPDSYGTIVEAIGMAEATTATNTTGTALTGTATYEGGAAGKYALPSPTDDTYEGGHFTAMATITADFDAELPAPAATNNKDGIALSGMIDNFMTGDTPRPNWMVKLMADNDKDQVSAPGLQPLTNLSRDASNGALVGAASNLATEWSMGTAVKIPGTWRPTFYHGDANPGLAGAQEPATAMVPIAVVGTFDAMGDAGKLEGAFGAIKGD